MLPQTSAGEWGRQVGEGRGERLGCEQQLVRELRGLLMRSAWLRAGAPALVWVAWVQFKEVGAYV